jgi:flagellar protein FlaG
MKEIISSVGASLAQPASQSVAPSGAAKLPVEQQMAVPAGSPYPSDQVQTTQATKNEKPIIQNEQDVQQAVEDINDHFQSMGRDLSFNVDKDSGRTIITVIDSETQEVVRQIPPEEVLSLALHLQDAGGVGSTGLAEKV